MRVYFFLTVLKGDRLVFVVEAALASVVSDSALKTLLKDPRVCKVYDDLYASVSASMLWLVSLPEDVWAILAVVAGIPSSELKNEVITAGHISFHFFTRRVLYPAGQRPWSLARGDIKQNL